MPRGLREKNQMLTKILMLQDIYLNINKIMQFKTSSQLLNMGFQNLRWLLKIHRLIFKKFKAQTSYLINQAKKKEKEEVGVLQPADQALIVDHKQQNHKILHHLETKLEIIKLTCKKDQVSSQTTLYKNKHLQIAKRKSKRTGTT